MKKLFLIILMMFLTLPTSAKTLTGGVTYTVESARKEAFANVEYTIPQELIDSNLIDPNFKVNEKAIAQGVSELWDRSITCFSSGGYAIVYKRDKYKEFYYTENGKLENIGIRENLSFPVKSSHYLVDGNLYRIVLSLSCGEDYIFKVDGQLESHWINNKEYDINGKIINKRY